MYYFCLDIQGFDTVRSLSVSTNDLRCVIQSRRKLQWFYRDLYTQVSMEMSRKIKSRGLERKEKIKATKKQENLFLVF